MAMRNLSRVSLFDPGLWLALLIGLLAASPFLLSPGLPAGTDAELHVYRAAELGYSLRAGILYPRWAPDFYHGYGYPIFNYYAPLTYHLSNWLTLFNPQLAAVGVKRVFILSFLLGAVGAYLLGREVSVRAGGVLGATAWAFSPYIVLVNPHIRGDLAEVFAVAALPLALWSWERLWQGGGREAFGAAVFSAWAVLLSHNLTGLTLLVMLMALSAWHWLVLRQTSRVGWALLAGILLAALSAYFWLPFLLERSAVKLEVAGVGHYDYRNHFVSLTQLLGWLRPLDWAATTPAAPMSAGPFTLALALIGGCVVWLRRAQSKQLLRLGFYALSAGLCFWLITAASSTLWANLPGLSFYQFPWRFLGPLAALLVPLIAQVGDLFPSAQRAWANGFLLVALLLVGLPGLYPLPWQSGFAAIAPADIIAAELAGRWRGTTSTNDFVPSTVDMIPGPQAALVDSYSTSAPDRVNRYTVPQGTLVDLVGDGRERLSYHIETPQKFVLRLYLFAFPGWNAYLDGVPISIELARPEGFITVRVPAGVHDVELRFEDTPPRRVGWWIAGVGLVILGIALWRFPRPTESPAPIAEADVAGEAAILPDAAMTGDDDGNGLRWAYLGLGLLLAFKVGVADHTSWFHYTSPPGEVRAAQISQQADFGGEIALLGFDFVARPASLDVTLYWQAQRPLTETYQSFVHILTPDGQVLAQSDHLNPGGFPTNLWPRERYVWDLHQLAIPQDAPAGEYTVVVGLYTLQDARRLPVRSASSGAMPDAVVLERRLIVK